MSPTLSESSRLQLQVESRLSPLALSTSQSEREFVTTRAGALEGLPVMIIRSWLEGRDKLVVVWRGPHGGPAVTSRVALTD
jgi:hypothetical protein